MAFAIIGTEVKWSWAIDVIMTNGVTRRLNGGQEVLIKRAMFDTDDIKVVSYRSV